MKNLEIDELNEKARNTLKKDDQKEEKIVSWFLRLINKLNEPLHFEIPFSIFVLFAIFGGIVLAYVCESNDIHLPRMLFRALGFDL